MPEVDISIDNATEPSDVSPQSAIRFEYSSNFPIVLRELQISLLVSTYQAGKLLTIGTHESNLKIALHSFDQVMGVAVSAGQLAVGARRGIHLLNPAHDVAPALEPARTFDRCWLTRQTFTTGSIHVHDLAWGREGLWVVNTLFSCLCTLDPSYNFVPRWQPPFISQLIDQDRCHFNGLAMRDGAPAFVTVLGETDTGAGWRENKKSGGAIIDVATNETIVRGLCMPHSPRFHQDRLWVLNSGRGELSLVDQATGQVTAVAQVPGYTRGLSFYKNYAFVGLSKIRETNIFGGLPIGEHPEQLKCGVGIIDLATGRTIATLQFHSGVEELFAVEVLPNTLCPKVLGPKLDEVDEQEIWIVPQKLTAIKPAGVAEQVDAISVAPEAPEAICSAISTNSAAKNSASTHSASTHSASTHSATTKRQASLAATGLPPAVAGDRAESDLHTDLEEGIAAHQRGQLAEALQLLENAVADRPLSGPAHTALGSLLQDLGREHRAIAAYQKAIEVEPGCAAALQNLGVLLVARNQPHRALDLFGRAQQIQPQVINYMLAAKTLPVIYESSDEVAFWRKRVEDRVSELVTEQLKIDATQSVIPTSFYFAYQGYNDRELMSQLAQIYQGKRWCEPASGTNWRPAGKKPRIGFVSAHFCKHTIGRLNIGMVEQLARDQFELSVIALRSHRDEMADRFRQAADHYVEVPRSPSLAAKQIAELGLDILLFADVGMDCVTQSLSYCRMAPVQAVTWGHPVTTGSPEIDYFISSDLAERQDADQHYTEQLVRMPSLGIYYDRPLLEGGQRTRESFGLQPHGHVYLCPQTLFKFHPMFDQVLVGILHADPLGELVLIEGRLPEWTTALKRRLESLMPTDCFRRIKFLAPMPPQDFLHLLRLGDVMLDPFPFGGGNSIYESLAVGTPVVTLPREFLRGRLASGLLGQMTTGNSPDCDRELLGRMVVSSEDTYIASAVEIASDESLQKQLRQQIAAGSNLLFNNKQTVIHSQQMLHGLCTKEPS